MRNSNDLLLTLGAMGLVIFAGLWFVRQARASSSSPTSASNPLTQWLQVSGSPDRDLGGNLLAGAKWVNVPAGVNATQDMLPWFESDATGVSVIP